MIVFAACCYDIITCIIYCTRNIASINAIAENDRYPGVQGGTCIKSTGMHHNSIQVFCDLVAKFYFEGCLIGKLKFQSAIIVFESGLECLVVATSENVRHGFWYY